MNGRTGHLTDFLRHHWETKMKLLRSLLFFACVTLLANAHAGLFFDQRGSKSSCLDGWSRAWCALDAANLAIHFSDLSKSDITRKIDLSHATGRTVDLAMAGAAATGALNTPGVSRGISVTSLLLGGLLNSDPTILGRNQVFGWMPIELAPDANAAALLFKAMLMSGAVSAFPESSFETGTTSFPADTDYSISRTDVKTISIKSKDCGDMSCQLFLPVVDLHIVGKAKETNAPQWLGGYKAWQVGFSLPEILAGGKEFLGGAYAQDLARSLPSWIFISISPSSKSRFGGGISSLPINTGYPLPVVFNGDKVLLPIYPEVESKDGKIIVFPQ